MCDAFRPYLVKGPNSTAGYHTESQFDWLLASHYAAIRLWLSSSEIPHTITSPCTATSCLDRSSWTTCDYGKTGSVGKYGGKNMDAYATLCQKERLT